MLHGGKEFGSVFHRYLSQCPAQVFKRAGRQFSKRAFSALCSMIKKARTTVPFINIFMITFVMVTRLTAACLFALP